MIYISNSRVAREGSIDSGRYFTSILKAIEAIGGGTALVRWDMALLEWQDIPWLSILYNSLPHVCGLWNPTGGSLVYDIGPVIQYYEQTGWRAWREGLHSPVIQNVNRI